MCPWPRGNHQRPSDFTQMEVIWEQPQAISISTTADQAEDGNLHYRRWSFECHWQGECEQSADQWQCLKSHGTSPVQIEQPPHKWLWLCGNQLKFGTTFPRRHCRWWLVRGTIPKSPGFRFGEFHSNSKKSLPLIKDWDWWFLFPIK